MPEETNNRKIDDANLANIERDAKAATKGPWSVEHHPDYEWSIGDTSPRVVTLYYHDETPEICRGDESPDGWELLAEDAHHISNMDPETTLELIAEIRQLRGALRFIRTVVCSDLEAATASRPKAYKNFICNATAIKDKCNSSLFDGTAENTKG